MAPDAAVVELRSAILRGDAVATELGIFVVRSTGQARAVWLLPSDGLLADVLDARRTPLYSIEPGQVPFISFADDYAAIVPQLRQAEITTLPDPDALPDTPPAGAVAWRDLGWFAVVRGPGPDEPPTVVFRQSDALAEALRVDDQ